MTILPALARAAILALTTMLAVATATARAGGNLFIFTWTDYTSHRR